MLYIRKSDQRGRADFGWLQSQHTFSFGRYYDPKHMGFSVLRVINDDTVCGGAGFAPHGHRDMEIISYVTKGAIEHEDSMGHQFTVRAGEVQRMSAGSGVTHSEFNASKTEELTFFQIWIEPNVRNIAPEYEQRAIPQQGIVTPLITPNGEGDSLTIHQDASMARIELEPGQTIDLPIASSRCAYMHVIQGPIEIETEQLKDGDGVGVSHLSQVTLTASKSPAIALWFDLPD